MADLEVVEICAGAGGQALGLERAGFEHALAVELDASACATLRANRPAWKVAEGDRVQEGDILFDMETGKAMMEVEAPGTGIIRDLAQITGEPTPVGTAVAWIHPDGEA